MLEATFQIVLGSSPHTWGILRKDQSPEIRDRFIPTYVGHTFHE